jgi:hypothetical protein
LPPFGDACLDRLLERFEVDLDVLDRGDDRRLDLVGGDSTLGKRQLRGHFQVQGDLTSGGGAVASMRSAGGSSRTARRGACRSRGLAGRSGTVCRPDI